MNNDTHPQHLDPDAWHTVRLSGQYRFGIDATGLKSWQCKYAGMTIYGLKSRAEALAKIQEMRDEKIMSNFFRLDNQNI